jgi:uncharacterized protein YbjT (DUF2867 family)
MAVTHTEIATALSDALGHPVTFRESSPDDFAAMMASIGMPRWQIDGLLEDYAHYRRGEAATVSTDIRAVTGREPRSIAAFAHDYAPAFASVPA